MLRLAVLHTCVFCFTMPWLYSPKPALPAHMRSHISCPAASLIFQTSAGLLTQAHAPPFLLGAVQVVEGSVAGLEMAQSEGLRRLSGSINSSLVDAESALQVQHGAECSWSHHKMQLYHIVLCLVPLTLSADMS